MSQIESHLISRQYEGLLKTGRIRRKKVAHTTFARGIA